MRFSVWPTNQQPVGDVLALARHAADTGWDGVWVADHLMASSEAATTPVVEAWTTAAAVAATVPRVRIGTLVANNLFRHPGVVAKMAATLDELSGGRFVLGLGAGWQENEHRAYGIDLPPPAERLARLEEACVVIRQLLAGSGATHKGDHYTLDSAAFVPRPARLPLLIGAKGDRALGVVARHADEWNLWADPARLQDRSVVLERRCAEAGRDPATIRRSAQALFVIDGTTGVAPRLDAMRVALPVVEGSVEHLRHVVGELAELGLDELVVPDFSYSSLEAKIDAYDRFIAEVAPEHRS